MGSTGSKGGVGGLPSDDFRTSSAVVVLDSSFSSEPEASLLALLAVSASAVSVDRGEP